MPTSPVLDVTSATFEQEVIEASRTVPVIVDFWAPWCGPCRALGPILEKIAQEYGGRFRLAKVNSDENLDISRAFNVRSIPDVRAFSGGQQVSQFTGALPESQVRVFVDAVVPAPAEMERARAQGLRAAGDAAGALAALRRAIELDGGHHLAHIDLAEVLIDGGQHDEAATLLEAVPDDLEWDARVAALRQAIAFAHGGGSEQDLAARVAAAPSDLESRLALAGVLAARKAWAPAMDQLLEIIRRDRNWRDGEARRQMLAIFNLAAGDAELVSVYRRKLASTLN